MCLTCLPITGDLGPSKTYKQRRWTWVRSADPAALADGQLTVTLQRGLRPGCKVETDTYGVAEQPGAFRHGRVFLLANLTDPKQPDVYETLIGPVCTCTCDAGRAKLLCKHVESLQAVIDAGGFDRDEHATSPLQEEEIAPIAPVVPCLVCGESIEGEDGEVHAECGRRMDEIADHFANYRGPKCLICGDPLAEEENDGEIHRSCEAFVSDMLPPAEPPKTPTLRLRPSEHRTAYRYLLERRVLVSIFDHDPEWSGIIVLLPQTTGGTAQVGIFGGDAAVAGRTLPDGVFLDWLGENAERAYWHSGGSEPKDRDWRSDLAEWCRTWASEVEDGEVELLGIPSGESNIEEQTDW